MQKQLDGVVRNKVVYEKVAVEMGKLGFERNWQQCRIKIKNLTHKYRKVSMVFFMLCKFMVLFFNKVKDHNDRSGKDRITCPFFEELDAVLGTRASSCPVVLLESNLTAGIQL